MFFLNRFYMYFMHINVSGRSVLLFNEIDTFVIGLLSVTVLTEKRLPYFNVQSIS